MIKKQFSIFILRWVASSVGMFLIIRWFGQGNNIPQNLEYFLTAGFVFSVVNTIVKPLVTIFSLPLIILSLGLFTLVVNVAMMAFTIWLLPEVQMSALSVIYSTIIMSVINSLVNFLVPAYTKR